MEVSGWLKKRTSGKFKSWKRRFFVLDQTGILKYYDHQVSSNSSSNNNEKPKCSRNLTNFFNNVGAFQKNIPKHYDINWAFMFVTSDSRKPMVLVVAESFEEKQKWINFLNDLFFKEKLSDFHFLKESMYFTYNITSQLKPSSSSTSSSSTSSTTTTTVSQNNITFHINSYELPLNCYLLISLYIGDVSKVVSLNFVCRNWNNIWKVCQPNLMSWLIRFGQVQPGYRWIFWCSLLNITHGIEKEEFHSLIERATDFNKYEITKDVNRAFGTSTGKRMTERRSLAPTPSRSGYWHDDSDDEDALPRCIGRGRMDSIEEESSSCHGEERPTAALSYSSDEDHDEVKTTTGWGRVRSTQRWPATPEGKTSNSDVPDSKKLKLLQQQQQQQQQQQLESLPSSHPIFRFQNSLESQSEEKLLAISEDDIIRKKTALTSILRALSSRFENVGYCQGMDRIVVHVMRAARCAVSLRSVPASELSKRDKISDERSRQCFSFLEAIFNCLALSDMYSKDKVFGLRLKIYQMSRLLEVYCPELHQLVEKEGISLEIFTIGWIQTLFLYVEAMPAETIDRIWDVFIVESSWVIIFQVAIAIIRLSTPHLLGKTLDVILEYFNIFPNPEILEADFLLTEASKINITEEKLNLLQEFYTHSLHKLSTKPPLLSSTSASSSSSSL